MAEQTKKHKFELSDECKDALSDARALLESEAERHREEWNEKSERWQEGDKGIEVDAWIEAIENAAGDIDNLDAEPG